MRNTFGMPAAGSHRKERVWELEADPRMALPSVRSMVRDVDGTFPAQHYAKVQDYYEALQRTIRTGIFTTKYPQFRSREYLDLQQAVINNLGSRLPATTLAWMRKCSWLSGSLPKPKVVPQSLASVRSNRTAMQLLRTSGFDRKTVESYLRNPKRSFAVLRDVYLNINRNGNYRNSSIGAVIRKEMAKLNPTQFVRFAVGNLA